MIPDFPIIDFHCDLLSYLVHDPRRSPFDLDARCSFPQLKQGKVNTQIFAVFTKTEPKSSLKGIKQCDIFDSLFHMYPCDIRKPGPISEKLSTPLMAHYAFENASSFCSEEEPLEKGISALYNVCDKFGKPVYISLTWNGENRFGGGALTQVGLKNDGKRLLETLHEKHIAIDLSHTSDRLAHDILDYIEQHNLDIPVIASHSNARTVSNVPRNLPDELAKEIFKRRGIIGLNVYTGVVGDSEDYLIKHIAHWLELGGENHAVLGADFFYGMDISPQTQKPKDFFDSFADSSSYPRLFQFLKKELRLDDVLLQKLAHKNGQSFLDSL